YTYEWTMALSADAAGKLGKKFIVLDRPDPIRGDRVDGNVLDPRFRSFVGQYPVALRYGLTPGELLRYLVGTGQVTADVAVIPMRGWRRSMWWDETGIPWVNPSPNLRSLDATLLYPGTVFFEGTNATEGRGTDKPFQLIGAEWQWRPSIERLAGTDELRQAVEQGTIDALLAKWTREAADWQAQTRKYWIY